MVLTRAARDRGAPLPPVAPADEVAQCRLGDARRTVAAPLPAPTTAPSASRTGAPPARAAPPFARSLRAYGPIPGGMRSAEPSAGSLLLDGARLVFALSPSLFGASGEGGVLSDLASADEGVVEAVADGLHGEPATTPAPSRASRWRARPCRRRSGRSELPAGSATTSRPAPTSTASCTTARCSRGCTRGCSRARQLVDEGAVARRRLRGRERDERRGRVPRRGRRRTARARYARHRASAGRASTSSRPSTRAGVTVA